MQQLQTRQVILIIVFVCGMLAIPSWWVVFAWLILLIAIVAGRSFSTHNERYVYMASLAFLVLELLINCVAGLFFDTPLNADVAPIFNIVLYLLPLVPSLMALGRVATGRSAHVEVCFEREHQRVDNQFIVVGQQ